MNHSKIIIILLLILLTISSVFFYRYYVKYENKTNQLQELEKQQLETLSRLSEWQRKSAADDLFFLGEYEKAIAQYDQIALSGTDIKKLIEDRNRWIAERDSLQETLSLLISELDQTHSDKDSFIQELKERNNLLATYNRRIDSLEQVFEGLQTQLMAEQQALQAKEEEEATEAGLQQQLASANPMDTLIFQNQNNIRIFYFGQVSDGKANGQGTGLWDEGGYYFGNWLNNRRHGKGFFLWTEGDRYEGEYKDDLRHGVGTYHWANGDHYSGNWAYNKRQGQGTLYNETGAVIFKGAWENDLPAGRGK